jgi:hypothetical protein
VQENALKGLNKLPPDERVRGMIHSETKVLEEYRGKVGNPDAATGA